MDVLGSSQHVLNRRQLLISFIAWVILIFSGFEAEMSTEEIIGKILSKHPETLRKDLLERLERERRKTGGFISDNSLLQMIAADFGVEVSVKTITPALSTRDLVPSLSDVTVVGRVIAVFAAKTFGPKKGGRVASLLIADKSDILRVVLWSDKANLIECGEIKVGQIVRFSHCYTKEDRGGRVELHVGEKGEIETNPQDAEGEDYPTISRFTTKIGELIQAHKNKRVNTVGMVKELFPASAFKREDSSSGRVMRFTLADETGEIPVVVWNERVDELEKTLKKGTRLQIVNAKVKKAAGEGLEVHVDAGTYAEVLVPDGDFSKTADLKEGLNRVDVEGEVVTSPMVRNIKTSKGELVQLAVFELKDEAGRVWVSAWRRHADFVKNLKIGDKIIIRNSYVKRGFGDQVELSTRDTTSITKK
jgi:ssDNA-binding replication factor A large subunit